MADTDKTKPQARNESRVVMISLVLVIVIVAVIALIGLFLLKKPAEIIEGQAEATSVRVSGKLPGRVTEIFVKEGDMVPQRRHSDPYPFVACRSQASSGY